VSRRAQSLLLRAACQSLSARKSKPRNAAGEIFASTVTEITRAIRLYRKLDSREREKSRQMATKIDPTREQKQVRYQLLRRWLTIAVSCEPVSVPNSLLTGNLTGNFADSGRS
jgi:hypothetical protein